eukprot:4592154-Pyramimonas_sp.AAC.1
MTGATPIAAPATQRASSIQGNSGTWPTRVSRLADAAPPDTVPPTRELSHALVPGREPPSPPPPP